MTAALLLGARGRPLRVPRDGVSVAVVRQVSLRDALDLAARMKAVYLPALIVGDRGRG